MRNVLRWRRTCPICVFMRRSAFISTEARTCSAQLHIRHKSKVYGVQPSESVQGLYWLLDGTNSHNEDAPTLYTNKTVAQSTWSYHCAWYLCEARRAAELCSRRMGKVLASGTLRKSHLEGYLRAERLGPIGKDKCWWTCEAAILWCAADTC